MELEFHMEFQFHMEFHQFHMEFHNSTWNSTILHMEFQLSVETPRHSSLTVSECSITRGRTPPLSGPTSALHLNVMHVGIHTRSRIPRSTCRSMGFCLFSISNFGKYRMGNVRNQRRKQARCCVLSFRRLDYKSEVNLDVLRADIRSTRTHRQTRQP